MSFIVHAPVSLVLTLVLAAQTGPASTSPPADLDAFWTEWAQTVKKGDFEAYSAAYHEDAVLVSTLTHSSSPIAQALAGWKQGFVDTKAGQMTASVEFRFTERLNDATTAHETGIFRYSAGQVGESPVVQNIHFEALLVKKDGKWRVMMEFQKSMATEAEWAAAG